jgi:hypothetical protein
MIYEIGFLGKYSLVVMVVEPVFEALLVFLWHTQSSSELCVLENELVVGSELSVDFDQGISSFRRCLFSE